MNRRDFIAGLLALPAIACAPTLGRSASCTSDAVDLASFDRAIVINATGLRFSIVVEFDEEAIVRMMPVFHKLVGKLNGAPFMGFARGEVRLESVSGERSGVLRPWRVQLEFSGDETEGPFGLPREVMKVALHKGDFRRLEIDRSTASQTADIR